MDIFLKQKKENIMYLFENNKYVSRQKLNEFFDSDSEMRAFIRELSISENYPILNNQDGKGYYHPTTDQECEKYIKQETSRAISIFVRLKSVKQFKMSYLQQKALNEMINAFQVKEL